MKFDPYYYSHIVNVLSVFILNEWLQIPEKFEKILLRLMTTSDLSIIWIILADMSLQNTAQGIFELWYGLYTYFGRSYSLVSNVDDSY
jgi:hypothetical protein